MHTSAIEISIEAAIQLRGRSSYCTAASRIRQPTLPRGRPRPTRGREARRAASPRSRGGRWPAGCSRRQSAGRGRSGTWREGSGCAGETGPKTPCAPPALPAPPLPPTQAPSQNKHACWWRVCRCPHDPVLHWLAGLESLRYLEAAPCPKSLDDPCAATPHARFEQLAALAPPPCSCGPNAAAHARAPSILVCVCESWWREAMCSAPNFVGTERLRLSGRCHWKRSHLMTWPCTARIA